MANEDNLIPITSETAKELGAKGGSAKKGSKHLKTLIQEIGHNIDWDKTNLKNKADLKKRYGKNGWTALVYVAMTKAISGDPQAMKWLAENGFGKNIDITSGGEKLNVALVEFVNSGNNEDQSTDTN